MGIIMSYTFGGLHLGVGVGANSSVPPVVVPVIVQKARCIHCLQRATMMSRRERQKAEIRPTGV